MTEKFRCETRYGDQCVFVTRGDTATLCTGAARPGYALPSDGFCGLTPKQALLLAAELTAWADHQQQLTRAKAERRKARKVVKADPGKAGLAMAALMHPNARLVQPTR